MTLLKKLREQDTVRHIWGCVRSTHPHICRTDLSSLAFFSGPTDKHGFLIFACIIAHLTSLLTALWMKMQCLFANSLKKIRRIREIRVQFFPGAKSVR